MKAIVSAAAMSMAAALATVISHAQAFSQELCAVAVGQWKWVDEANIEFKNDFTATHSAIPAGHGGGTWQQAGQRVTVKWDFWKSTDELTLTIDGRILDGKYGITDANPNGVVSGYSYRKRECVGAPE